MNPIEYLKQKEFRSYDSAWLWKGRFRVGPAMKRRQFPSLEGAVSGTVKAREIYEFDKLYYNDGHWWLRILDDNELWFIAAGVKETGVTFRQANSHRKLWGRVSMLDTSSGKEKSTKAL